MSSRTPVLAVSASLTAIGVLTLASLQAVHGAPKQPKIDARTAPLLKVGGLSFKDLNRNGALDPYEDWRLPVEKRVSKHAAAWEIGVTARKRISWGSCQPVQMRFVISTTVRWRCITPLGRPVVPPE